jgi:hypothetical protein
MTGLYIFMGGIALAVGTFNLLDMLARRQARREREQR